MKRVIFFVHLTCVSLVSQAQNLVINPGFEKWEKTSKPYGWTTAQSCVKDSVFIRSGTYSCRQEGGTKYLGQSVAVIPGKRYRLSFFYKTQTTGSGNGCRMWCYWKDNGGNNITDILTDDILRPSKYLRSDTWQQSEANIAAPASASGFYLEVRTYQNSVTYFDDFVFEENLSTLNPEETFPEMRIYPNPAHDYLIINNIKSLQHIDILSLTGDYVWSSSYGGEQNVTITVSGLADGLYIVKIWTSDKFITRKFTKD